MTVLGDRWATGQHIGPARPTQIVRVRTGRFNRRYDLWDDVGMPVGAVIHNPTDPQSNTDPWQAFFEPDDPDPPTYGWVDVPNVLSIDLNNGFGQKGITSATVHIENIVYLAQAGGHHRRYRGYLAPLRSYVNAGRTPLVDEHGDVLAENPWYDKLARNSQIEVWEGYGDAMKRTFVGFIDRADMTSRPDTIIVTARMGKMLTDERVFGWNMDPDLRDPITFIDKDQADDVTRVAQNPTASSSYDASHGPGEATDGDSTTAWWSDDHTTAGNTEWVSIEVTEGRYSDYGLTTYFDQMEAYISVYAKPLADGSDPQQYDSGSASWVDLTPNAWVDAGLGDVPGAFGGRPYVKHIAGITSDEHMIRTLDTDYRLGVGSEIRLHFRDLGGAPVYRAGVRTFYARRRTLSEAAKTEKWIRVEDMADVVKVVLRWAGFKEWEVESTGVTLPKRLVVSRGMTYRDVISKIEEAIGYVFYMKAPTEADESLGVPVFRYNNVVAERAPLASLTDSDLLTQIQVTYDEASLSYIIRVRGRESKDGQTLGGDGAKRVMAEFRPPWATRVSPTEADRLAGFIKHEIRTMSMLRSIGECLTACHFIALQEALESMKATVALPANPELELDEHVVLEDLGTGVTSRFWIGEWRTTLTTGEKGSYVMTLAGALVDTPDVAAMVETINEMTSI